MAVLIQKYPKRYFGINETSNIFTGDAVPVDVANEYFRIPSVVNIQGEEWVAVNTGYVPLATQPTEDFEFEITNDNGGLLQALDLIIGKAKDPSLKPARNVVVWINEPYVQGCYYVNSAWLGKVFHIKKGKYISTTANAPRLNEISSNYEFVNNVEQAINDTIDSNNILKKYVDGSYITETKKANNKIIYASNAVNSLSSIYANSLTTRDLDNPPPFGGAYYTDYKINRKFIYIKKVYYCNQDCLGEINIGDFGYGIFFVSCQISDGNGVKLLNQSDFKINGSMLAYRFTKLNSLIFGIVCYTNQGA